MLQSTDIEYKVKIERARIANLRKRGGDKSAVPGRFFRQYKTVKAEMQYCRTFGDR